MFQRRNKLARLAVPILAAAALALTGCGSGASSSKSGAEPVKVGYFPLAHTSTVVNADKEGLLTAKDLTINLVPTEGGAAAITALTSGSIDIGYTNYTSILLAVAKGLPIRVIEANDVGATDHGIFVKADSDIQSVKDLGGKTFAVNSLQTIGALGLYSQLTDAGVDPATTKVVEIAFPDMQAALERGSIDAAWLVEPFQAGALAAGNRRIGDMFTGSMKDIPVAGWMTTDQYAKDHPDVIEKFASAIKESKTLLAGDREKFVSLVPTFTKVPAAVVEKMTLPSFESELSIEKLQLTADLMHKYGLIEKPIDASSLLIKR
ncbi:ABC transporter substrate-binding protein [Pseudarthrobacter oxydans]|uniref:ABC transporter substrate-binding protein n=1 Tax=Pseudarthrobacter oxydans TaxID=1671 RepID=UPI003ECE0E1E